MSYSAVRNVHLTIALDGIITIKGDGFEVEIARMGGPGEHSSSLLDPGDEHMGFIPSDIRGRGGHMKNKHVVERGRDKTDRQAPLPLVGKQLYHLPLFFYLHLGYSFICLLGLM